MRPLHKYLSLILLFIFISLSVVKPPVINAVSNIFVELVSAPKTLFDYGKEFCDKRSGDLMNLETWYSGKCKPGVDTLSGDGVGFSDIVLLQGAEYIIGPQYYSFIDLITNLVKGLQCASNPAGCLTTSQTPNPIEQGIIPALAKATTAIFNAKPATTVDYLAYVSSNLKQHKIVDETFAAGPGYGFTALSPILPLWRAFRNVAYLLFAFGFVLYGIMIMFRVRIDSKTAATIQLAIPRLISTLLIITFSYAIVGLLVDISTIAVAMSINILKAGGILTNNKNILVDMASGSFMGLIGSFIVNGFSAVVVSPLIFFNLLIGGGIGAIVGGVVGAISLTGILGFIGWIAVIIVLIAIIISFLKLGAKLFQAYFGVIINLIFAPVILLGGLFPGSTSTADWLKSIYGNLAVFPVASFFLVLSYALMAQPFLSLLALLNIPGVTGESLLGVQSFSTLESIWTPPMTVAGGLTGAGAAGGSWIGSSVGSLMLATIGFGLLMMSSKYVEMVEKALKTPPFPYGAAIGEALKSGVSKNESMASGGYRGLGGGRIASGIRNTYKRGYDASGNLKDKPSIFVSGTDTGITAPK